MAPKAAPLDTDAEDAPLTEQSPPDRQMVRRLVAELVRYDEPTARNIRIVYEVPAGDGGVMTGRIPIPVEPDTDDLKAMILTVLAKLKPGEYMKGAAVAMTIDENLEHTSGSFKRAIRELKGGAKPKLESHPQLGYRLPVGV